MKMYLLFKNIKSIDVNEFVLYGKTFNFILRKDQQKLSYERRDYELVGNNSLSWVMSQK